MIITKVCNFVQENVLVILGLLLVTASATPMSMSIDVLTSMYNVPCVFEEACSLQTCNINAYGEEVREIHPNNNHNNETFPFNVMVTSSGSSNSMTYTFQVCSTAYTSPLKMFQVRLKDSLITAGSNIMANPSGMKSTNCAPMGIRGYVWNVAYVTGQLHTGVCHSFSVTAMASGGSPMPTLADICPQDAMLVDNQGNVKFNGYSMTKPFCLFFYQTANNASGYGAAYLSPPMPSPSPNPYGPHHYGPSPYGAYSPSPVMSVPRGFRRF